MDRLHQIRGEAGSSRNLTLDSTSSTSEAYVTANDNNSKYFSLSEGDSTLDISPTKDSQRQSLSPIPKNIDDSYNIGKQIEAANILSGGIDIFDNNENSYDGDELVIDDNIVDEDKTGENLCEEITPSEKTEIFASAEEPEELPSKDSEVVLQIDGKNVNAIDIGNGLYLYRKAGQEELAAVQIIDDDQNQPSFKFLKVRENDEGNLEVYEEIKIEVPQEVPTKEDKSVEKISHVPIKDINKVINEPTFKATDKTLSLKTSKSESVLNHDSDSEITVDLIQETKVNGKMKFNESRKSPVIGAFMPMTFHSTPNKEGIPLTKTMVDQQLTNNPSRSSDNVKKTIEVHTDNCRQKLPEISAKTKNFNELNKTLEEASCDTKTENQLINTKTSIPEEVVTNTNQNERAKENVEVNQCENNIIDTSENVETNKETSLDNELIENLDLDKKLEIFTDEKSMTDISEVNNEKFKLSIDEKIHSELNESKQDSDQSNSEIMTNNEAEYNETKNNPKVCNEAIEFEANTGDSQNSQQLNTKNEINNIPRTDKIAAKKLNSNLTKSKTRQDIINENIELTANQEVQNISVTNETKDNGKSNVVDQVHLSFDSTKQTLVPEDSVLIVDYKENKNQDDKDILSTMHTKQVPYSTEKADVDSEIAKNDINVTESINNSNTQINRSENQIDSNITEAQHKILTINKEDCKQGDKKVKEIKNQADSFLANTVAVGALQSNKLINTEKMKVEDKAELGDSEQIKSTQDKLVSGLNAQIEKNKTTSEVEVKTASPKPINNNSAVPFGKWTEANRQEFLNKIKETKIPSSHTNTKQLKQPNDLNRRDVLKKIDSQRQTSMVLSKVPVCAAPKPISKKESTIFINKPSTHSQTNPLESKGKSEKMQQPLLKPKSVATNKIQTNEPINFILGSKKTVQRKEINNQDLIDKTIEGIINRAVTGKPADTAPDMTVATEIETHVNSQTPLDYIEMKMNELHGIPSEELMSQEISDAYTNTIWSKSKNNIIPSLLPFENKEANVKENVREEPSDEEIIEHEPITGDMTEPNKQSLESLLSSKEKTPEPKKETIITENDFDKFARRNSKNYENCLTVNFDCKEPHNVIQTVVEMEPPVKKMSRNEMMLAESKAKSTNKHHVVMRHSNQHSKIPITTSTTNEEDAYTKKYQSKVQMAYQTAITAKKHVECPITIIEDKPVKVVFMDQNIDFTPMHLNVQGQELSPSKSDDSDIAVRSASESLDSDILESNIETKLLDETKSKSKHQRKQVLTPVEEPELELIEPDDLGIEISSKKKRKLDDKSEKPNKNLVPKKSYLLNRNITNEHLAKHSGNRNVAFTAHTDAISAIDNLVKAAELIETISENKNASSGVQLMESQQNTPVKRGRGRPRKYPLPESGLDTRKNPTPQKKPRLIDAKPRKSDTESDIDSDGEIKENWTMGKINENIVCPICNKLFRSENVVFKHVKHCTGVSPNRSDSDKRSPRRLRHSPDSDSDSDYTDDEKVKMKSRKPNNLSKSIDDDDDDDDDVIVVKDTYVKEKSEKKIRKTINEEKTLQRTNNIICEICGKSFRQLSYLINHKLQHKNEIRKEKEEQITSKSVFCCEVCKKEFRKLHHLVQHRIIHNMSEHSMSSRLLRKSSSEQRDNKSSKNLNDTKPSDDASAGFRCEPCDKSFRKLHHLVEHRETHDGINKKVNTQSNTESCNKPSIAYHCDKCNKIFKKLQDYLEHKDQHLETSSEKSDDKSVKSSLSTKDIIHECSLCYMVFPNEHSLNKHTIICLRKKRQSAAKKAAKDTEGQETIDIDESNDNESANALQVDESIEKVEDEMPNEIKSKDSSDVSKLTDEKKSEVHSHAEIIEILDKKDKDKSNDTTITLEKRLSVETKLTTADIDDYEKPNKMKKIEENTVIVVSDTPVVKKKTTAKEKGATVMKCHKTVNGPLPSVDELKPLEVSDDDEIRYMLNPDFKEDENADIKLFFNERAKKRNSLQFDRPSQDLVMRRVSLQHPPKIPRLKVKPVEIRPVTSLVIDSKIKTTELSPLTHTAQSTDSDDSDVKYSFPEQVTNENKVEKRGRKSLSAKRKSLSGIAKRKSLGKPKVTSTNKIKKRTTVIEHRCDCGQLFSSAALLSRHAILAHTPPRRRRLSPLAPPPPPPQDRLAKTNIPPPKTNLQSSKTNSQASKTNLQSSKTNSQSSKTNLQSSKTKAQVTKTYLQSSKTVTQPKAKSLAHKPNTVSLKTNAQSSKPKVQTTKPNVHTTKTKVQSTKTNTQSPKTHVPKKLKCDTVVNKHKKSTVSDESTSDAPRIEFVGKKLRSSYKGTLESDKPRKLVDKLKK